MEKIKVLVNGKDEEIESGLTISEFLKKRRIRPEVVTVEINDRIIEKKNFENTVIKENDRIELVFYMGGGWWILMNRN